MPSVHTPADAARPALAEALATWARIGLLSFGGPAGQIALMHRVLVEEKRWLAEEEYLAALNFCMLLPGPEAMQLASYAGWKLHGWRGGVVAGTLFVVPGALVVLVLAAFYARFGDLPAIDALFFGIKAAVLAIVIEALLRVARRALTRPRDWWLAGAAFVALFVFDAPFPAIIAAAGVLGYLTAQPPANLAAGAASPKVSTRRTLAVAAVWLALWWLPIAALVLWLGGTHVYAQVALFFSKLAVVTFGGAYAVLSYMAQQAVEAYGWLGPAEMIDGLGLAETTPGPLILVTEFVGFIAGYRYAGLAGGAAAAAITLWVTFVPCFLWVLAGAPYVEQIRGQPRLSGALAAITAAVVGVILNLSLWFALHVTFATVARSDLGILKPWLPHLASLDVASLALSVLAAIALLRWRLGLLQTLGLCAAIGLLYRLVL